MGVRKIMAPSTGKLTARGRPMPAFNGKRLGVQFIEGYATVDETLMSEVAWADGGTQQVPVWERLLQEFKYIDVTPPPPEPEPAPEPTPAPEPAPEPEPVRPGARR